MNSAHAQSVFAFTTSQSSPLVLAYGMGVDSTALLVGWQARGIRPDLILFADVGSEKPATYAYLPVIQDWLARVGFPPVVTVRYQPRDFKNWPPYRTLGQNCLTNGTLPSLAFGFKSCSLKWKVAPQDAYVHEWGPAQTAWIAGQRVVRAIGYDAGPADSRRYAHAEGHLDPDFDYLYPLREWGWDREECAARIREAGLPVPVKSACFFCPSSKPHELHELPKDQLRTIVVMESRATPRLRTIQGLWRNGVKGVRSGQTKPGRMTDYIRERQLLPGDEIEALWRSTPPELIEFQEAYAEQEHQDALSTFLRLHRLAA